jgi:hypothetical protein
MSKRALSERPDDPAGPNNLAWLYQQLGNLPKTRCAAARLFPPADATETQDADSSWLTAGHEISLASIGLHHGTGKAALAAGFVNDD